MPIWGQIKFLLLLLLLLLLLHGVMGGEENDQMGVGQDWVCFDGDKWYGGEEDEVLVPHRPKQRACKSD